MDGFIGKRTLIYATNKELALLLAFYFRNWDRTTPITGIPLEGVEIETVQRAVYKCVSKYQLPLLIIPVGPSWNVAKLYDWDTCMVLMVPSTQWLVDQNAYERTTQGTIVFFEIGPSTITEENRFDRVMYLGMKHDPTLDRWNATIKEKNPETKRYDIIIDNAHQILYPADENERKATVSRAENAISCYYRGSRTASNPVVKNCTDLWANCPCDEDDTRDTDPDPNENQTRPPVVLVEKEDMNLCMVFPFSKSGDDKSFLEEKNDLLQHETERLIEKIRSQKPICKAPIGGTYYPKKLTAKQLRHAKMHEQYVTSHPFLQTPIDRFSLPLARTFTVDEYYAHIHPKNF
jgi:hypothetical protein